MKKQFVCTILSAVILSFILCGCSNNKNAETTPAEVTVTTAKQQLVPFRKDLVGETVAEDEVNFKARITGFLTKSNFKWGSIVQKGQVLFEIEKNQYEADLQKSEAELANALAVQKNSDKDFKRKKGLYFKNAVSEEDYDNARMTKETADANVINAEGALKIAKLNLTYTTIKAPFTGKIDRPEYSVGNLVGPDSGTLATIVKLNPMQVEFNPDEALYLSKDPTDKQKAQITAKIKLSNNKIYKYNGKVTYTDNKVDSSTGTIKFRATFPNPDNYLLPGQYVDIILEKNIKEKSIVIPQKCLMSGQIGQYVYIVNKDNEIQTRKVLTGGEYGKDIIILEGLNSGEKVVTEGMQTISNGEKVKTVQSAVNTEKTIQNSK
jgi:membrane fusion protein, multidrug efflux system